MTRSTNKRNVPTSDADAVGRKPRTEKEQLDVDPGFDEKSHSSTLSEPGSDIATDEKPQEARTTEKAEFSVDTHPCIDAELAARLTVLNAYHNPSNGCATLRTIEFPALAWGNARGERGNKAEFLYYHGNVLTVWMIGEVTYRTFMSRGYNVRRPTVRIRPLLKRDLAQAVRIQNKWSKPAKGDEHDSMGIWASRWMGDQSMTDEKIPPFDRVFDAMDMYRRKSEMEKYPATDLELGDLVLAEFFVTRWIPKDGDEEREDAPGPSKKKPRVNRFTRTGKRDWKAWNVEFRLDALSIIALGREYYQEQQKPDEDVEI